MNNIKGMAKTLENPDKFFFEAIERNIDCFILTITLNRSDKRNAINTAMARELVYLLRFVKESVFSAGGDLAAMRGDKQVITSTVPSFAKNEKSNADLNLVAGALRILHKPSVVVVEGDVFADALLIICNASHVYANGGTLFGAPEIKRGLWPYMAMTGLFRIVPKRVGLDWMMTGESINAETSERWGLINASYPNQELNNFVNEKLVQLKSLPPKTLMLGIEAYNEQEDLSFDEAMPYLAKMLQKTIEKGDAQEGISAFLEKRKPHWLKD